MSDISNAHSIEELPRDKGYWYLATPYSKWAKGIDDANRVAQELTGRLIISGVPVFSPIAHTHGIALAAGIDPFSHAIFMPADKPLVDAACGLLVANLDGWSSSYGVRMEIDWFRDAGKPIFLLDPATLRHGPFDGDRQANAA